MEYSDIHRPWGGQAGEVQASEHCVGVGVPLSFSPSLFIWSPIFPSLPKLCIYLLAEQGDVVVVSEPHSQVLPVSLEA